MSTDGQEHVPSAVGPMGRSMDTLHLAMKAVLEAQPWKFDARCSPIPWRQDLYDEVQGRPLVVGILLDDEVVRPHPPISRVMNETIKVLRDAGHEIVEWNAQYHAECVEVMVSSSLTGSSLQPLTIRPRISFILLMVARISEMPSSRAVSPSSRAYNSFWMMPNPSQCTTTGSSTSANGTCSRSTLTSGTRSARPGQAAR